MPRTYVALNRLRPTRRDLLVRRGTVLTVEGPMRSGNTYVVAAFERANPDVGHIARHLHAPAHVLRSVQLDVPTVVLLRPPADVALSHVIRRPSLGLADSLRDYVTFFEVLDDVRDDLVTARFETVTDDLSQVIATINERFATSFEPYHPTEEAEAQVLRRIERMNRRETDGAVREASVARPSLEREQRKRLLRPSLERGEAARWLARARSLHEEWTQHAV